MTYADVAGRLAAAVTSPVFLAIVGPALGTLWGVLCGWWAFGWRRRRDRFAWRTRMLAQGPASRAEGLGEQAWELRIVGGHLVDRQELVELLNRRFPWYSLDPIEERRGDYSGDQTEAWRF